MNTIERVRSGAQPAASTCTACCSPCTTRAATWRNQVADELREHFHVYETVIPRNVRLAEAPSHGKPIDPLRRGLEGLAGLPEPGARDPRPRARSGCRRTPMPTPTREREPCRTQPKRRALGRGLDSLLPGAHPRRVRRPPRRARPPRARIEELHPDGGPAAPHLRRREARGAGAVDPRARRARADPGAQARRRAAFSIIAGERRWRAAQRAGLHDVPVVVRELTRRAGLRGRAGREPPARRPQPDRDRARVSAPDRRAPATRRRRVAAARRQGPLHGRQRAAPAQAARRRARHDRDRRSSARVTAARCSAANEPQRDAQARAHRRREGLERARDRARGALRGSARQGQRGRQSRQGQERQRARPRDAPGAARSAPRSTSPTATARATSRSTSRATTSSTACSRSSFSRARAPSARCTRRG